MSYARDGEKRSPASELRSASEANTADKKVF